MIRVNLHADERITRCVKPADQTLDQLPAAGWSRPTDSFAPLVFRKLQKHFRDQECLSCIRRSPDQPALAFSHRSMQLAHLRLATNQGSQQLICLWHTQTVHPSRNRHSRQSTSHYERVPAWCTYLITSTSDVAMSSSSTTWSRKGISC